jgi:KDEL-tailed cysteine endopeptidase
VAAIEGIVKIKTRQLISLSEQEVLDCTSTVTGNEDSCNGGFMNHAFDFVFKNGGLATEADYPYNQKQGYCNSKQESPAATIRFESINFSYQRY